MCFSRLATTLAALFTTLLIALPVPAQELQRATVAQAKQAEFIGRVSITGSLVARNELMVNPLIAGQQIIALHVDIGDHVEKGQLLAELDRETLEIRLAQAEAEKKRAEASVLQARAQVEVSQAGLDSERTNFERDRKLLQSGTVTQAKFDQAETVYRTAQASQVVAQQGLAVALAAVEQAAIQVRQAELNLSYTQVTARAGGVISSRNATVGAIANPGPEPLFRIIRDNLIELRTEVLEDDIARIDLNDEATLQVAGLGKAVGTVRLISPRVDQRTRLGEIRIALPEHPDLRIGSFASGWVQTEHFNAVGIPVSAVLSDVNGDYVQVVDEESSVHRRRVETGLIWNGMREVRSGLRAGETVILVAGAFFRSGDQIIPVLAAGAN